MNQLGRPLTRESLAEEFTRAGLRSGDSVILHSSLKSLGAVEGGAEAVVQALLDVIGETGHLLVPTFTYCLPIWNIPPFDVRNSKSRVGAITEAVRLHEGAVRSFHPTHSVAVIGPGRDSLVKNHLHATPLGVDCPFDRMRRLGAKILMLGTTQDTNSSLHLCEVLAKLPYVNVAFSDGQDFELAWFINEQGEIEYTPIYEVPGCSRGFRVVEGPLRRAGVLVDVHVGLAPSQLLDLENLIAAMLDLLRLDPVMLLCTNESCAICTKRRAYMKKVSA
ncbi:MAG: AAC(3) family N-acetyltransferase [Candidatus Sumerlaeaceae bacterium]|nr:AAC(3) family N-acetyltransferase [Candidatus Sumerlaeaceae bacterium]